MARSTLKPATIAGLLAGACAALALQGDDRGSHRHDDRGHDRGYSHDQRSHTRDSESRSHDARRYEGSHNEYHGSSTSFSIGIVTPNLVAEFGTPGARVVFRTGYYHHDRAWVDSRFLFRFYLFDYDRSTAAFSPFYYYPSVPGYVALNKVDFGAGARFGFDGRTSWNDRDRLDRDLENAIYDLQDGVRRQDKRAMGRVVPSGYWVDVDPNIGRPYSIGSDDFYDLMTDMASATDTTDYRVLDVETGRDCARVVFEHDFRDPWGHSLRSFHRVTLDLARDGYRVARMETNRRRF